MNGYFLLAGSSSTISSLSAFIIRLRAPLCQSGDHIHRRRYRIRPGSMSSTRDEQTFRDLYLAHWQRYRDLCAWGYDREPLDRLLLSESLQFLMSMEPSDDPLFLRADGFVSGWQGETDGLYAVYRNALKLWRIDKTLFHTYWRGRGYKVRPSCPPAYLDERKGS